MKSIAIIGAGQSGLQLGLSLLQKGYGVTLVNDRTPAEIRKGKVMSSQMLFHRSLEIEKKAGLNLWEDVCPKMKGISFKLVPAGETALEWSAGLDHYAWSVDQRVKLADWLERFDRQGGRVLIEPASVTGAEKLARTHDLVIIATGKGEMSRLFGRDPEKSTFTTPQRALSLAYVHTGFPIRTTLGFSTAPGVGECFLMPALTLSGPCEIIVFEGVPGGPMDCWRDVKTPDVHLRQTVALLERVFPAEAPRYRHAQLTDDGATLSGGYTPEVRTPVAFLPSGKPVLGMGDAVVLNDPITGQGANNAAKCADVYLQRIVAHSGAYDPAWMQQTFDQYWAYAKWVTAWTNAMLLPPPPHVQRLMGAAAQLPGVAEALANGFDNPPDLFPWIADPAEADRFIAAGGRRKRVPAPAAQPALC